MFSFIKKNIFQNISSSAINQTSLNFTQNFNKVSSKSFVQGKWNLRKFRKETSTHFLKDLTKSPSAKEWMKEKLQKEKSKLKEEKLSTLVQTDDKKKLSQINPYFKPNKRQFNKYIRKKTIEKINLNEQKDFEDLSAKLFSIDHTAQVLENIRRLKENKIFSRKLHEVKEKKLALKLESRKLGNVIEDFNQKFQNFENYNGTRVNSKNYNLMNFFFDSNRTIGSKLDEPNVLNISITDKINKEKLMISENNYSEYLKNKNELTNIRISNMLSSKRNNPELQKYLEEQRISGIETDSELNPKQIESSSILTNSMEVKLENNLEVTAENQSNKKEAKGLNYNNDNSSKQNSVISNLYKSSHELEKENKNLANSLSNLFQPHIDLTNKIQQYELDVYNEYKNSDLYQKYNKGIVKFGDLSLQENLNYIKFNIINSKEIFKLFNEVKHKDFIENPLMKITNLNNRPVIYSSLLQKLATGYKEDTDRERIFSLMEYKDLLKSIKENLPTMKNRTVVDNFWSIAKIHKTNRNFSQKFFQHFLKDILSELKKEDRISSLTFQECSFLCEGLNMVKIDEKYDDKLVANKESELVENLINRLLEISEKDSIYLEMHPFNYAKILNYFYYVNLDYQKYARLLANFGKPLKKFLEENSLYLTDVIKNKDVVSIVRAYAWAIAKYKLFSNSISGENQNEIFIKVEISGDEEGKAYLEKVEENKSSGLNDSSETKELTVTNNSALVRIEKEMRAVELFKEILYSMTNVSIANRKIMEISQCTKLIYHFACADVYHDMTFKYLQMQIKDKLSRVEDFKIDDVLQYTYGMAKYLNKEVYPDFSNDVNSIIYPNLNEKLNSLKFSVINLFKGKIFERKNMFNPESLSIICYSAALMGYSDIDFYLPIYHNIIAADSDKFNNNKSPKLKFENLGYLMQSLSLLNFNDEYILTNFTQKCFSCISPNLNNLDSDKSQENENELENFNNLNPINDFSLSQVLSALVNLSSRKYFRTVRNWKSKINSIRKYADTNFSEEHSNYIVSLLWFLTYFENFEEKFYNKMFEKIEFGKLRKYEKIVLNQIILKNYITNNYVYLEFTNDILEDLNKCSLEFENERKTVQKKISLIKYQEKSFEEKAAQILKDNEKLLQKDGLDYHRNFKIANSYLVPFYFPKTKICLMFYDHSEMMKDKNINGYNSIKEDIILDLGYKIERVYGTDYDRLVDSNERVFEFIYNKIKI